MNKQIKGYAPPRECTKCKSTVKVMKCESGYLCNECLLASRTGRDETTQVIKQDMRDSKSKKMIAMKDSKLDVIGLLPEVVMADAAMHRGELLTYLGTDCAAMALAAEQDIQAENSLEKMLAHQLATSHKSAMELMTKGFFEDDLLTKARVMNIAVKMMEVFQKGLLTAQRLKSGGNQNIVVQHVTVSDGGQAVIGNVKGKGDQ